MRAMKYTKTVLRKDPIILMWEPEGEKYDVIIEIQSSDFIWSDTMINTLIDYAEELVLTQEDPERPQFLLGGEPFKTMLTSFIFMGTTEKAKKLFIEKAQGILLNDEALTHRDEIRKHQEELFAAKEVAAAERKAKQEKRNADREKKKE